MKIDMTQELIRILRGKALLLERSPKMSIIDIESLPMPVFNALIGKYVYSNGSGGNYL
jgi:hypothetical protein